MPTYPAYKLGDVADYINGRAFKPKEWKEKGLPIVRIQNLNDENAEYHYSDVMHEEKYLLRNGDLLFAWAASLGTYIWNNGDAWLNQHIFKVIPKENVSKKYLYYALTSIIKELYAKSHGSGMVHVTKDKFINTEIPLPPLSTQHAIVSRIESLFSELDKGVEHLRTAQQQLKAYRQAVLNHWLNNDDGKWKMAKLGDVAEKIFDGPFGTHLKSDDYVSSGIRVVRLENIKAGYFDDSKQSFVTPEKYEIIKRHTVYPTDLIMSTFISEEVKVCQMPKHIEFAVNKADCIGIRLKPLANNDFIKYYLSLRSVYHQLEIQVHGATRPRVNTTQIKSIEINLPPLSDQQRIVAEIESRLSQAEAAEARIAEALQKTEALRQSILKKAFSGELVQVDL
jgi:type I restriction enzyme S subunit